ncbi:TspO/MBR family protein [Ensifer sp. ENS12]|uniref:TspO/MBR family protein n=1 Tax=Ensifer sp. ENS12 TaxID=2854774 RepID=UPI002105EFBA|nr:TspO/MBR family protein [Ensifer sp. ENS12]
MESQKVCFICRGHEQNDRVRSPIRHWSRSRAAMRLWLAQMFLNFLWSPLFFGIEDISSGLIIALLIAVAGFVVASRRRDRVSALLFLVLSRLGCVCDDAQQLDFAHELNLSDLHERATVSQA